MPRRTWWQRNWKWVVPLGGLTLLAGFALIVFGIVSLVFGLLRGSAPYQHAVSEARGSAAVVAALGEPIQAGFMVNGNIATRNDEGEATLTIPLQGPKASARLYVEASRERGRWDYQTLSVVLDDDTAIDLLEGTRSNDSRDEDRIRQPRREPEKVTKDPAADY
jgi:hypothetical protein